MTTLMMMMLSVYKITMMMVENGLQVGMIYNQNKITMSSISMMRRPWRQNGLQQLLALICLLLLDLLDNEFNEKHIYANALQGLLGTLFIFQQVELS